ncbi:MAG: 50S ribosomal protein L15 [Candidatus Omnitrophota bacterium]|jgi:large subunit ribosomal protein L15
MKKETPQGKAPKKQAEKPKAPREAKKAAAQPEKPASKPQADVITRKESVRVISLHNLIAPRGAHKKRKIKGRGSSSGHGKTSTRGSKGQTSRAGRDFYLGFEGGQTPLIRRMPKRGFNSKFPTRYQIVNLDSVAKLKDTLINPAVLYEQGIVKSKNKLVKILGNGEIKQPKTFQAHAFSQQARDKITSAGGKFEVIDA